jgi:hypothetical protein
MKRHELLIPLSTRFINFWLGWWIAIYGFPMAFMALRGNFDFFILGFGHLVWATNAFRIFVRNLNIHPAKVFFFSGFGLFVHTIAWKINDNIFYKLCLGNGARVNLMHTYYVVGIIHFIAIVIFPIIVFIYIKICLSKAHQNQIYEK